MDTSTIAEADMTALTAQGYTEADLSMLHASEIQALLHDDKDDAHEQRADVQPVQAAAAPVPPTDDAPTEDADDVRQPTTVQLRAEVPADAAEQIKLLQNEEREAFKLLMAGDSAMDADAYQAIRDRVDAAVDELKTKALTATIFEQVNEQTAAQAAQNEWNAAQGAAMATFKAEGIDYRAKPALMAAYNTHLKALGADAKNEKRDAPWFLSEAHRLTKADLGFVAPAAKTPAQQVARGVDMRELPPTLRGIPAAGGPTINTDEFAHMRNLTGSELEKAHAMLTEAQRDRYMAE